MIAGQRNFRFGSDKNHWNGIFADVFGKITVEIKNQLCYTLKSYGSGRSCEGKGRHVRTKNENEEQEV